MKFIRSISAALLLYLIAFLLLPTAAHAATFRSGETVSISETLRDLYAAGGTVTITSLTENDLTAAGGTVRIEGNVQNSLLAAGGTVSTTGAIGNNARIAGGTIRIEAPVRNDLVVAGGTIDIDNEAQVGGDLVVTGGTVRINAPVRGNVWLTGGQVEINSTIGGNVWGGEVGQLRLGPKAVINGDLNYTAEQRAVLAEGATIRGKEVFTQEDHSTGPSADEAGKAVAGTAAATIVKLIGSIIVALFFVWLLPRFFRKTNDTITTDSLRTGLLGFATLILMPIVSAFLLLLIWVGVASFLLYFIILIVSVIVVHLFVGWWILRWWYGRDDVNYELDWKAAIVGPVITTLLWFVPVAGWLINFVLWLLGIGALVTHLWNFVTAHRNGRKAVAPAPAPAAPARRTNGTTRTTASRSTRTTSRRKK